MFDAECARVVGMVLDFAGFLLLTGAALEARFYEDSAENAKSAGDIFRQLAENGERLAQEGKETLPKQASFDQKRAAQKYQAADEYAGRRKRLLRGADLVAFPMVAVGAALQLLAEVV